MNGNPPTPAHAASTPHRTIAVALSGASYTVHVGEGLLPRLVELGLGALTRRPGRAFLCFDANVPGHFIQEAREALTGAGLTVAAEGFHGGEAAKSLATVERLAQRMAHARLERWDPVVVVGGGVAGDAAGFAASIYRRGVPVVQCPSTLLSMVDASVGGKTGVNLDLGPARGVRKNLLGTFHQPVAVLADTRLLASLPERQFRCGLAECVKHAMIGGHAEEPGLFDWTERNAGAILNRSPGILTELIARNVAVKARIVESDPREEAEATGGGRALLNLGHTFGHAIEPMPNVSPTGLSRDAPLEHGEAVAIGLAAAVRCATLLGRCPAWEAERVGKLLQLLGLPRVAKGLPPSAAVYDAMLDDKKISRGRLRLVLPSALTFAAIVEDPPPAAVQQAIDSVRGVFTPDCKTTS